MAECLLCGKEFKPYSRRHVYCSKECCRSEVRRKAKEYRQNMSDDDRLTERIKARKHYDCCYCKICGEPIKREFIHDHEKTQMHEECIINDCRKTLQSGKMLNSCQRMRLYSIGYTVSEFKELIENAEPYV